jgi:hypothetical protein
MNTLLATIAAFLLPEVNKKTTEAGTVSHQFTDVEKNVLERMVYNATQVDAAATRVLADVLITAFPDKKALFNEFQMRIGNAPAEGRFQPLTMLFSLSDANHRIARGEAFLVTDGKEKRALNMKGELVVYDERERSSRLATQEETERYCSNLTNKHLAMFASSDILAKFVDQASEKLATPPAPAKPAKKAIAVAEPAPASA